jgi:hypothetical protein
MTTKRNRVATLATTITSRSRRRSSSSATAGAILVVEIRSRHESVPLMYSSFCIGKTIIGALVSTTGSILLGIQSDCLFDSRT